MKVMLGVISLWVIRVLLVFLPQSGYIHPDEFFQSVEVAAGDIFDVQVQRAWEFNATFPLRSAVAVHAIAGIPLRLLTLLNQWISSVSSVSIVTAYTVLVTPRLFLALLSFLNDYCVWNLSKKFGFHPRICALIYASSYVTLVFYTRTMSNTMETLLFNALLIFITSHLKSSIKGEKPPRRFQCDEDEGNDILGNLQYQTVMSSTGLGILIACGVFNRPTFLVFAFVPVLYWLINSFSLFTFIARVVYVSVGFIFTSAIIISLDTVYYKNDSIVDLEIDVQQCLESSSQVFGCIFQAAKDHLIITPINFIIYNTKKQNLESHGAHPWYLHLTVNSIILFGPIAVLGIIALLKSCIINPLHCLSFRSSKSWPLLWMLYFPILILSVFPHQEPRFLIPLLTPIVLLTSQYFSQNSPCAKLLAVTWVIFNLTGFTLFGFLHQGGVVPSLLYLNSKLNPSSTTTGQVNAGQQSTQMVQHLIFSHSYMPPEHLLMHGIASTPFEDAILSIDKRMKVYDLKGADVMELENLINSLKKGQMEKELYLLTPYTRLHGLCEKLKLQWVTSVFPHLSMEDPPMLQTLLSKGPTSLPTPCVPPHYRNTKWHSFMNAFSFVILKVV